jgi:uncharacterized protein YndB with AHSA1/START domain
VTPGYRGHAVVGLYPEHGHSALQQGYCDLSGPASDIKSIRRIPRHQFVDQGGWIVGPVTVVVLGDRSERIRSITLAVQSIQGHFPILTPPRPDLPRCARIGRDEGTWTTRHDGGVPRTDSASRVIAAPPDRVFAALIDPDALTAWLPPPGMSARFERFDARPGGTYRMVLTYADAMTGPGKTTADSDVVEARFIDIVPGVRVVQAVSFVTDDPGLEGTMTMTWEVTATGDGTRVDIRADQVPVGISAEDHAAGLASSLANLAAYVQRDRI